MQDEGIRDCVKKYLENGIHSQNGFYDLIFKKMRFAIIYELNRVGNNSADIKNALLEWNQKNEKPLHLGEARRQLCGFADWFLKHECKLSCERGLADFCVGINNCKYKKTANRIFRNSFSDIPFNIQSIEEYLKASAPKDVFILMAIINILKQIQSDRKINEIFIGFRSLASLIQEKYNIHIDAMQICRKIRLLIEYKILTITQKGKAGNYNRQANGYTLLPWPGQDVSTHNHSYV
jgi:hypothetical protein